MPIIKKSVFDKTTILTNEFLQSKNISLEAKGLLGYMLSLPNNWDFTIAGIANSTNTSEYKIIKLLQELEANGYHTKKHIYENGRIKDWVYYIFAEPRQDIIDKTFDISEFEQDSDFQDLEKQDSCFSGFIQTISNKLDIEKEQKQKEYIREEDKILTENVKCIIDYLNETAGTKYKYNTKSTIKDIKARFKEGYKLDDFYDVIDKKWKEWKGTEFEQYIRPSTLFGNKFESYYNTTLFQGKAKTSYGSKPTFDNTSTHNIPKALSSMSEEEKAIFYEQQLARDENGNYLKF